MSIDDVNMIDGPALPTRRRKHRNKAVERAQASPLHAEDLLAERIRQLELEVSECHTIVDRARSVTAVAREFCETIAADRDDTWSRDRLREWGSMFQMALADVGEELPTEMEARESAA